MVSAFPGRREERIHDLPGAVVVVGHEVRVGGKDNLLRVAKVGGDLGEAEPGTSEPAIPPPASQSE
jgi:hypothetical protein